MSPKIEQRPRIGSPKGGVAERSNAPVFKTGRRVQRFVGSNPTASTSTCVGPTCA